MADNLMAVANATALVVAAPAAAADEPITKKRKVSLGLLLKKPGGVVARAPALERDELDEYLQEPVEADTELDLLAYWKRNEARWPKLAKMAKQYLAAPASSAPAGA